jgi:hypothetical protein
MPLVEPTGPGEAPLLDREPVAVFIAGLTTTINAAIVAGEAFGWLALTPPQSAAIITFATVVASFAATIARTFVYCRVTARRAGFGTP